MDTIGPFLTKHPYFSALTTGQLGQVTRIARIRTLARGEILALEGERCETVYFVVQGRIRAYKVSPQGREQVISELVPGQSFYLPPALDGGPLPVTTQAATRATLIGFRQPDFLALLRDLPPVALAVLADLSRRLRAMTSLVEDLALRSVPARLARFLLARAGAPDGHRTTQREMAARLGTVREVVARTLAQFERQGWVRLRRGVIEILDADALRHLTSAHEL